MPVAPVDRKILLIGAGVFVVMIGAALFSVRGASSSDDVPTAYSTGSRGCRAAFLLLQESGYQAQTWEQPLRDLPIANGKGKTLVIVEPTAFPAKGEKQKLDSFLKSGGRVIAAGKFANVYLPQNAAVPDPEAGTLWKPIPALSLSPITRAAPEITLAPEAYWRSDTGAVGLYGEGDKPVVVEYMVGEGSVLWSAASTPFTNAGIKEPGNLEFLLAAIGGPGQNQVLWDEFVHGYERSEVTRDTSRIVSWIGLQLAILAAAILFAYSRRSGPIWIPEGEVRLSPLEFVRTLGSLYEHAHAGNVAVEVSCQRFRYLLTRRLGLSLNTSVEDLTRAVRERKATPDEDFAATLSECESRRYDSNVPANTALRLVQKLFDYAERLELIRIKTGERKAWKQS